jgi:outer membrane protein assembly factor BamA
MILRLIILLTITKALSAPINADSIASKRSIFAIPHLSYQPETNWATGVSTAYYFKSNNIKQISSIQASAVYTLNNQFLFTLSPRLFSNNKKWLYLANLNLQKYPDYFYGIGNKPTNIKVGYNSRNFSLTLQPQYIIQKKTYIGLVLAYKTTNLETDSSYSYLNQNIFPIWGNEGWSKFYQLTTGFVAALDTRDNLYYPERGAFIKAMIGISDQKFGSTYSSQELNIDSRFYKTISKGHIIAVQGYFSHISAPNGVPFQLLPTLGGSDQLRGFRKGVYRDRAMVLIQSEYRAKLYKKLKAAIFIGTGNVYNTKLTPTDKIKIAYGAGLRYQLNDARVHLRLDIANNNYGDKLQFYLTASEAF